VTVVTTVFTGSPGVGWCVGAGAGAGLGDGDWETGAGRGGGAAGACDIGRVVTPPGAIVPPVEPSPFDGALVRGAGAGRPWAPPPPPDVVRVAITCTTGIVGIEPLVVRAAFPLAVSGPALGAGGPENTCPSTPSWLKPPPSASATSAATIADGTIRAAPEAAHS
jgi:hypothetical protein